MKTLLLTVPRRLMLERQSENLGLSRGLDADFGDELALATINRDHDYMDFPAFLSHVSMMNVATVCAEFTASRA
jgi:hypothetical protein